MIGGTVETSASSEARYAPLSYPDRKAARENKEMKFTALLHHLTVDLLRESFYSLKRRAAPEGLTVMAIRQLSPTLSDKIIA